MYCSPSSIHFDFTSELHIQSSRDIRFQIANIGRSLQNLIMIFIILFSSVLLFIIFVLFDLPPNSHSSIQASLRRRLSLAQDWFTGENTKTINGVVPETSCPLGTYRPPGNTNTFRLNGQREDGCVPCPLGTYGDSIGLTSKLCSGLCPVGTYSDMPGLMSSQQCKLCPPGYFGAIPGQTSSTCSGPCPLGTYTDFYGATTVRQCKSCPYGYRGWQCTFSMKNFESQAILKDTITIPTPPKRKRYSDTVYDHHKFIG